MKGGFFMENKQDVEHLNLLSTFHYVVAGLAAFFGSIPIIHLIVGILMVSGAFGHGSDPGFPKIFGIMFIIFPLIMIAFGWTLAILFFMAARALKARRRYQFCQIVAGIGCIQIPFGTILGIFTLIVLMRPSVKAMFDNQLPNPQKFQ